MKVTDSDMNWQIVTLRALPLWPLLVLLLATQRYLAVTLSVAEPNFSEAISWYSFQWGPWMLLSPLLFYGLFKTPLDRNWLRSHLLWVLLWGVVLVVLHTGIQALLKIMFYVGFKGYSDAFIYLFVAKAHIEWLIYVAMAAIVYVLRLGYKNQRMLARNQAIEALVAKRQLDSMRRQLSPHFLFNALNSLCGLLPEESRGHDMTVAIGGFLHRVLDEEIKQLSSVHDEVALAKSYLLVENIRFSDQMTVNWDIEPAVEQLKMPSMILQPLVENAIVHGVNVGTGSTHLDIKAKLKGQMLSVKVINTSEHQLKPEQSKGTGKGLMWIEKTLEGQYAGRANMCAEQVSDRNFEVEINIPVDAND